MLGVKVVIIFVIFNIAEFITIIIVVIIIISKHQSRLIRFKLSNFRKAFEIFILFCLKLFKDQFIKLNLILLHFLVVFQLILEIYIVMRLSYFIF